MPVSLDPSLSTVLRHSWRGARGLSAGLTMALAAAALAACHNTMAVSDALPIATDTLVVYAINGTPTSLPSAIALATVVGTNRYAARAVDLSASEFEIAVDVDSAGRAVLLPPRLVKLTDSLSVGFQRHTGDFQSLSDAPRGTYVSDSAATVTDGEVLAVQAAASLCRSSPASAFLFAKLVVDSVGADTRAVYMRVTVDPNCGNRSLAGG